MEGLDHVGICSFSLSGDVPAWIGYRFGCDRENCVMESLAISPPLWAASLILIWLAILSYFDIKTRMVPHIAWVFIPCLVAIAYRAWLGGWALSGLALTTVFISERNELPMRWQRGIVPLSMPLIAVLTIANGLLQITLSLAIIGFWLAWESRVWGGADALVSITFLLLWPDIHFLMAILAVHLMVFMGLQIINRQTFHRLVGQHRIPEIPLMMICACGYFLGLFLA